jgi:hypothetical protein
MTRRPIATVRVLPMPRLGEGAVRIEVECSASTTGITHVPGGPIDMDIPMLITFATYEHEERCDVVCDTSRAHAKGDRQAREYVERMKVHVGVALIRRHDASRRN